MHAQVGREPLGGMGGRAGPRICQHLHTGDSENPSVASWTKVKIKTIAGHRKKEDVQTKGGKMKRERCRGIWGEQSQRGRSFFIGNTDGQRFCDSSTVLRLKEYATASPLHPVPSPNRGGKPQTLLRTFSSTQKRNDTPTPPQHTLKVRSSKGQS